MATSIKIWQRPPPSPFSVAAAAADPLRCLSLSAWKPLQELRRGAQIGAADYRSVWCIGLYRLPSDWVWSAGSDKRRMRVGPVVFVSPVAMRMLLQADGATVAKACERLAQLDLLIPSHETCLTWPAKIPGSGSNRPIPMYALRGEVGFLDGAGMPLGLQAIAAVTRVALAGWYAVHEPIELLPVPGWRHVPPTVARRRAKSAVEQETERKPASKRKQDQQMSLGL